MKPKLALDTNAYRALRDGNSKLVAYLKSASQIGLPVVVLGELYFGIYNGSKREMNLADLNRFLQSPRLEVLNINETTTRIFGEVATELRLKGRPIQQNDLWIAAICKQQEYVLATADSGFGAITGLELFSF